MARIETYARPIWLYRYRSLKAHPDWGGRADPVALDRELEAIRNGYIYCSTYRQMNDPMEGFFESSTRIRGDPDYDQVADDIRNEKLQIGIASLSETWDNELMWAHYADGFRGICVMYSVRNLLANMSDEHTFARVAYGDRPHYLSLAAMTNEQERARAILSTKNLKWSYEREWRLFAPQPGKARSHRRSVQCVYLGMRMAEEDRSLISARLNGAKVQVRQTFVDGYSVKRHSKPKGE